jgi:hypothetical protein
MPPSDKKRQNLRMALTLASVAVAVFLGFVIRTWYLNH